MPLPSFQIHVGMSNASYVKMNGELLPGVRGVTVHNTIGEAPRVMVEFYSTDIDVTVDGDQVALRIEPNVETEITAYGDAYRRYITGLDKAALEAKARHA